MEISTLLVSFCCVVVIVQANLTEWRIQQPMKPENMLRAVEQVVNKNDKFYTQTKQFLSDIEKRVNENSPNMMDSVQGDLNRLSTYFLVLSYAYVVELMKQVSTVAVNLLQQRHESGDNTAVRRLVSFVDRRVYCVITALHDFTNPIQSFKVDRIVENMFLLHTIADRDTLPIEYLKAKYQNYVNEYTNTMQNQVKKDENANVYLNVLEALENKTEITAFSDMFCSAYRPFIDEDLLSDEDPFADYKSHFIRYMYQTEICTVNFNHFKDEAVNQYRMDTWECSDILETEEYEFRKYKKNVTAKNNQQASDVDSTRRLPDASKGEYSLETLKTYVKSNRHHLNYLKYYNVASDVMLMVAIKEGDKILKGIKHSVANDCSAVTAATAVEMRRLGAILATYIRVFDALIVFIEEQKHIKVADRAQKKAFDGRAASVAALLDVPEDSDTDRVREVCSGLTVKLGAVADAHLGDQPSDQEFEKYYFTDPIHHVGELYEFNVNDYK